MNLAFTRSLAGAALIVGVAGAGLFVMGCCNGPDFLTFGVGDSRSQFSPNWGERGPAQGSFFFVEYAEGKSLAGEPLEFYLDGASVDVPMTMELRDNNTVNGCGFSQVLTYDMSALPPGDYTVVHRRANGTGDAVCNGECLWEDFEGEEALVMVMELS